MKREMFFNRNVLVFDDRPKTVPKMLEETVEKHPNREAVVMGEVRLTYRELAVSTEKLALHFQHHYGLQKGDRVALLMGNTPAFIQIFLACATLGVIAVPLNVRSSEDELLFMLNHANVQVICAEQGFESVLQKWQDNQKQGVIVLTEDVDSSGKYEQLDTILEEAKDPQMLQLPDLTEEDPLYIMFTSGTTGRPKGAIGSHLNVIHSAINYREVLQATEPVRTLIAVPLFHVTGLIGQLFYMLLVGGTNVLMKRYQTEPFLRLIEKEKITFLFNVPTIYIMMLSHPRFKQITLDSLEVVTYGGAPMPKETIDQLMKELPSIRLHNAYGATETSSPAAIMPKHSDWSKMASVGKPVPVGEVKIIGEDGEELQAGNVGELYIKGPMIVEGYWINEEANRSSFENEYWKSGDMAMLDKENYLYIMDRKKDMINRGGEKVFSAEVENVLYEHPEVLEAAVVGIPDSLFGEEVKAFIVPKEGGINSEPTDIQAFLKQRISDYKVPKYVEVIESMPRNPGGKVLKTQLLNRVGK